MADLTPPLPATLADALQLLAESGLQAVAACREMAEAMRNLAGQSASEVRQMRGAVENLQDPQ